MPHESGLPDVHGPCIQYSKSHSGPLWFKVPLAAAGLGGDTQGEAGEGTEGRQSDTLRLDAFTVAPTADLRDCRRSFGLLFAFLQQGDVIEPAVQREHPELLRLMWVQVLRPQLDQEATRLDGSRRLVLWLRLEIWHSEPNDLSIEFRASADFAVTDVLLCLLCWRSAESQGVKNWEAS
eukprot:scaffold45710_cov43-Prasinocladus_malaysianus.AAC.1